MGQATERILDALGIRHVRPRSIADLESQADGLVKLCYTQSLPVAFILPPELTGGKLG
jgi:hypothetical protein